MILPRFTSENVTIYLSFKLDECLPDFISLLSFECCDSLEIKITEDRTI